MYLHDVAAASQSNYTSWPVCMMWS